MNVFICYPKCTTCQKAKAYLDAHQIEYIERDIKLNRPTKEELNTWFLQSGLDIKRFFNTSGLKYKELNLKERLGEMSEEEKLALLSTDGMLVKRPIWVGEDILVGFKEEEYRKKVVK